MFDNIDKKAGKKKTANIKVYADLIEELYNEQHAIRRLTGREPTYADLVAEAWDLRKKAAQGASVNLSAVSGDTEQLSNFSTSDREQLGVILGALQQMTPVLREQTLNVIEVLARPGMAERFAYIVRAFRKSNESEARLGDFGVNRQPQKKAGNGGGS